MPGKLNEKTDKTKRVIHLMVTSLCERDCQHCCNKQYPLESVPYVTEEELREAETICITGGEPFAFSRPNEIAGHYRKAYPNIRKAYAYTNAMELFLYIRKGGSVSNLDGITISIKSAADRAAFERVSEHEPLRGLSNIVYVFDDRLMPRNAVACRHQFKITKRERQEDFVPADDSIFRRI